MNKYIIHSALSIGIFIPLFLCYQLAPLPHFIFYSWLTALCYGLFVPVIIIIFSTYISWFLLFCLYKRNSINNFLKNNQNKIQHSVEFKISNKYATLADQEEALKEPWSAYYFACLNIPGTDIRRCQEAACKIPAFAYRFMKHIPGADMEYCRKVCEKSAFYKNLIDKRFPRK